jgi:hypothetical protein
MHVSDVKAAPALLSDKGFNADRLRRSLRAAGAPPVSPDRSNRKRAICSAITNATSPRMPYAASKTFIGSLHATTSWPTTFFQVRPLLTPSHSGSE